jgi:hypothetical protein
MVAAPPGGRDWHSVGVASSHVPQSSNNKTVNLFTFESVCAGAKGGLSGLDLTKVNWQKISRKGDFPSTRCGSAVTMYKSKALLFGGVFDEEGRRYHFDPMCILGVPFVSRGRRKGRNGQ